MLHVSRNMCSSATERSLVEALWKQVTTRLPMDWTVEATTETRAGDQGFDTLLVIGNPQGQNAQVIVEHATRRPQDALEQLRRLVTEAAAEVPARGLLTARYLSPKLRQRCTELGLGYSDTTGSLRLDVPELGLFLHVDMPGRPQRTPTRRSFGRLAGPGASAVVEELLLTERWNGVRDTAAILDVDPATVSRTVAGLVDEGLVEQVHKGDTLEVDRPGLLRRWAQDYRVFSRTGSIALEVPRPVQVIHRMVREADVTATFTASVALRAWLPEDVAPVTELSQVVAYTADIDTIARELRARAGTVSRAPLVLVDIRGAMTPRTFRADPRWGPVVSVPRAIVDLMTSGGRGAEEAEQLLALIAEQDPRWT